MTVFMAARSAFAQQAAPAASAPPDLTPVANPVSGFVKAGVARYGKNMVAAAELMPAEKYSFKPSPEMNSFGHLAMHIAQRTIPSARRFPADGAGPEDCGDGFEGQAGGGD